MRTQKPDAWRMYAELGTTVVVEADVAEPSAFSVDVGSATVVPLGSVPFRTMVLVPFISNTLTSVLLRPSYEPSPIKLSKNVVSPLSSHPQEAYFAQRQSTGFVSLAPVSSWRTTNSTRVAKPASRRVLV